MSKRSACRAFADDFDERESLPAKRQERASRPALRYLLHADMPRTLVPNFTDTIIVTVGKDKTPFFLPRNVARSHSGMLARKMDAVDPASAPNANDPIGIGTEKRTVFACTFKKYVVWMLTGTLVVKEGTEGTYNRARKDELTLLWLLADCMEDSAFAKKASAMLEDLLKGDGVPPSPLIVEKVWRDLHSRDDLKARFVELMAWCTRTAGVEMELYSQDFVRALCRHALSLTPHAKAQRGEE